MLRNSSRQWRCTLTGCPHFTIAQVGEIVRLLDGRKFSVGFWVLTSFLTRELARSMGYLEIIEEAVLHQAKEHGICDQKPAGLCFVL